jgi:hypothetical protein
MDHPWSRFGPYAQTLDISFFEDIISYPLITAKKVILQLLAGCSATLRVFMKKFPKKISEKNFQQKISKKNFQKKFPIFFFSNNQNKNMPKLLRM